MLNLQVGFIYMNAGTSSTLKYPKLFTCFHWKIQLSPASTKCLCLWVGINKKLLYIFSILINLLIALYYSFQEKAVLRFSCFALDSLLLELCSWFLIGQIWETMWQTLPGPSSFIVTLILKFHFWVIWKIFPVLKATQYKIWNTRLLSSIQISTSG